MKTSSWLIGAGIVGGILLFASDALAKNVSNLETRVSNIRFGKIDLSGVNAEIQLEVLNTRNQALSADAIVGKLFLEGKIIGDVIRNEALVIGAKGRSSIWLPIKIYTSSILTVYQAVMKVKDGGSATAVLDYVVHVGGTQFNRKEDITIDRSKLPF